jgi:hypothetical protein
MLKLIVIRYNRNASLNRHASWYEGRSVNLDPEWLDERKRLFLAYCWPSLARQSDPDFRVLLLMDPETDPEYVRAVRVDDRIIPFFAGETAKDAVRSLLSQQFTGRTGEYSHLWTTRLDSDDALAPDYLKTVEQAAANIAIGADGAYFVFPQGQQYIEKTGTYRDYIYPRNAFGTLIEPFEPSTIRTVYKKDHDKIAQEPYAHSLGGSRAQWCMVIHGRNVLNTPRGNPRSEPDFRIGPNADL